MTCRSLAPVVFAVCLILASGPSGAQTAAAYPTKPIRIVTSPAGEGNDFPARLIARALAAPLGQQLIVDNRPTNVRQLIALAKAKPGGLNFSVGGPGTSNHVGAILFSYLAHVDVALIPYKGTGPALTAVVGEVHAMFGSAGGAAPHVKAGRLRALAVGSAQPSPLAPGVPTLESSGLAGFISDALHALFAPAGTPQPIIARLNQEVSRYLSSPEARKLFLGAGIEVAPGTPQELTAVMTSEVARLGKVLKTAGIGVQ